MSYPIIGIMIIGPWAIYLADKNNRIMQINLFSTSLILSILLVVSVYFGFWTDSYIGPSFGSNPDYLPSIIFTGIGIWILIPLSKRYLSPDVNSSQLLFFLILLTSLIFIGHSTFNILFWELYGAFGGTIIDTGEGLTLNSSASATATKISCLASLIIPILTTTFIHFKRDMVKVEVSVSTFEEQTE
jgi:hypothetical protein